MNLSYRIAIAVFMAISALTPFAGAADGRKVYRPLDLTELKALNSLAYPQSYQAIYRRFGLPLYRSDDYDYYPAGGNAMVRIAYVGHRAQFHELLVEGH